MIKAEKNILGLIGNTPIVELMKIEDKFGLKAKLYAKIESFNPAGSAKDRVAKQMLEDAEKKGLLKKNAVIIEPTSGNTGIGLAVCCAVKGYKLILTMPDTMSIERRKLLGAYGAEIVLTDGKKGMQGSIEKANELASKYDNSFIPGQFTNMSNVDAHYNSTGPEIWDQTDGQTDIFIASVGTGGTLTGTSKYLKEKNPKIKVCAVEPAYSAMLSGKEAGSHKIQGIGANFIPEILDRNLIDEVCDITDESAYEFTDTLVKTEGILCGISSGAVLSAAIEIAKREENTGKNIVCIFTDTGERYLSSGVFG